MLCCRFVSHTIYVNSVRQINQGEQSESCILKMDENVVWVDEDGFVIIYRPIRRGHCASEGDVGWCRENECRTAETGRGCRLNEYRKPQNTRQIALLSGIRLGWRCELPRNHTSVWYSIVTASLMPDQIVINLQIQKNHWPDIGISGFFALRSWIRFWCLACVAPQILLSQWKGHQSMS